jgi:hypothetical protein
MEGKLIRIGFVKYNSNAGTFNPGANHHQSSPLCWQEPKNSLRIPLGRPMTVPVAANNFDPSLSDSYLRWLTAGCGCLRSPAQAALRK